MEVCVPCVAGSKLPGLVVLGFRVCCQGRTPQCRADTLGRHQKWISQFLLIPKVNGCAFLASGVHPPLWGSNGQLCSTECVSRCHR